jgi:hypothetical protein
VVKTVELRKDVLNLWEGVGPCTWSIHEVHLILLQNIVSVNLVIRLLGKLVLEAKQMGKLTDCDLILSLVRHPHELLAISIKVEGGIELVDNLIVLIVLETHHVSHLELITSGFDAVEVGVATSLHPLPVYPLGLYHRLLLVEIDGPVPI